MNHKRNYTSVASQIYQIRLTPKAKEFKINKQVTEIIRDDLQGRGKFYNDGYQAYFFSEAEKKLMQINLEDTECRLMMAKYGINRTESIYRYLMESLGIEAIINGTKTTIHRLSYYNPDTFTVYLYNHGNQVYWISPDKVKLVDNGTDGILFVADPRTQPFKIKKSKGSILWLDRVLLSKINPADSVLTAYEVRLVVKLWFYSLFFREIMPTKGLLLFLGPKGSGKSITARKIGMLLFGGEFNVTPLTKDIKDFDAAITNSDYVAIDNADSKSIWFEDRLAIVATGGNIKKRQLYTTNTEVDFPVRCFMSITSRTPTFRRDDVVDRLLILESKRFEQFISEHALIAEVRNNRNEIMYEVVYGLKKIVRALRDAKDEDMAGSFRMADFADFCIKIGRLWDTENEVKTVLTKLQYKQDKFTIEADPVKKLLYKWALENPDREVDATTLNSQLTELAMESGIKYPYEGNPRSFAQKLGHLMNELEGILEITSRTARGGVKRYRLTPKWAKTKDKEDGGKGGK